MNKRLRMFAGPNGSGKSTVKAEVPSAFLGVYLNPDEIEAIVNKVGYYDLAALNLSVTQEEINQFFSTHPLLSRTGGTVPVTAIKLTNNGTVIDFETIRFNSYYSAILTDFLRHMLIQAGRSFTFETVMSSLDKVYILQKAQQSGFRTYLYYVATEDPTINIARIEHRVREGGHNVPTDKVIDRYYRSLDHLLEAIRFTNRAYIFDNSGQTKVWLAEITDGSIIQLQTDTIPQWFVSAVLDKL